jgi:hypothetical protein
VRFFKGARRNYIICETNYAFIKPNAEKYFGTLYNIRTMGAYIVFRPILFLKNFNHDPAAQATDQQIQCIFCDSQFDCHSLFCGRNYYLKES